MCTLWINGDREYYFDRYYVSDCWPQPPSTPSSSVVGHDRRLVFLLSIGSGGGTTNLLGKFVRESGGQHTRDIILIAEAHGITETFDDIHHGFGNIKPDIETLISDGLNIHGVYYEVRMFFSGL